MHRHAEATAESGTSFAKACPEFSYFHRWIGTGLQGSAPEAAAAEDGWLLQQLHNRGVALARTRLVLRRVLFACFWRLVEIGAVSIVHRVGLHLLEARWHGRQEDQVPRVLPEWRICSAAPS